MRKLYRAGDKGCALHKLKLSQAKKGYLKNRDYVYFKSDGYYQGIAQWRIILSRKGKEYCESMGVK